MTLAPRNFSPAIVLAVLGGVANAQQASFTTVPGGSSAMDVSADGSIVVGTLDTGDGYYWRWQQDPAPTPIGQAWAVAVSDDGSAIAGMIDHPVTGQQVAARWTQATGWVALHPGMLGECGSISSASDISGDGKSLVGLGWSGCSGVAFLWTEAAGFTLGLESLGNGQNRASAISRDGLAIGGFAQGDFSRTPAVWDPAQPPATSGTVFDMAAQGEVHGFSDDGSALLGGWLSGTSIPAMYWPGWKSDPQGNNRVLLGSLNPGWNGQAVGMAEIPQGESVPPLIVGYDSQMLAKQAWVWTQPTGILDLRALLVAQGVPGVSASLSECTSVSSDGRVITGRTIFGDPWIVHFPAPGSVTVYGCGVNPAGSLSVLSGSPQIGQTLTLGVGNPLGTQPAGSLPFLFLATKPSPLFPCGSTLPGTGMGGGGGELLIDIFPPNPVLPALTGQPWAGPGTPAPVPLVLPLKPSLIGKTFYAQGILADITFTTIPVALTDAVEVTVGG